MSEERNISGENSNEEVGNENPLPEETGETTLQQTQNLQPETNNMEVHHHTHTPRKKWNHYLWEFLMLFLAVFCGFLAENQREHYVEHQREKQYVKSFLEDLRTDITQLDSLVDERMTRKKMIDSLIVILSTPDPDMYAKQIYYLARPLTISYQFFRNERTIQQLKNGGNLRLIRKQNVSDAIMEYDHHVQWTDLVATREQAYILEYVKRIEELFDTRVFNRMGTATVGFKMPEEETHLLKKDKSNLQLFINKIHFLSSVNDYHLMVYHRLLTLAKQAKETIEREYFIK
jgi:hypothetical protein